MPKPSIRVIVVDMDDTLLRSDGTVSDYTVDILRRWRNAGGRVIVATGRPPRSVAPSLPAILHDVPFVCYNGADVRVNGSTIYADLIPTEDARLVVATAQETLAHYAVGLEIDDCIYLNRAPDRPKQFVHVEDLCAVATRPAAKILFFPTLREAIVEHDDEAMTSLLDNLPASIRLMRSNRFRLIQLMSRTADKVEALRVVLDQWGLDLQHAMAIGDDVNDVEMVRHSGIGVAVANAVPEVHAVAARVTGTNDEDGVAAVVEELLISDRLLA